MNKITFEYIGEYSHYVSEKPYPAKENLPKWFRDMPPYAISEENPDGKNILIRNFESNATAKKCTPMLDSMTAGYIVPLWSDVQVSHGDMAPIISWRVSKDVFQIHGGFSSDRIPSVPGYDSFVYKYITHFRIKTPKGYSVMIQPPSGHYDLPFYAIPATIDTDRSTIDLSIPCWVKKDFNGIVEKGTPIAQIIPFKRNNWTHEITTVSEEQYVRERDKGFNSTLVNNYVKKYWSKKSYK